MTLVDSVGWIEFFTDGLLASEYAKYLQKPSEVIVPTIVLYEVYKKIKRDRSDEEAITDVAQMLKTRVVPLSESLAFSAADISLEHNLPMADSMVYATAAEHGCKLVTMDHDFHKLPLAEVIR